jgi:hypothetical protein
MDLMPVITLIEKNLITLEEYNKIMAGLGFPPVVPLGTLDPEKEIKTVVASGCECEEDTNADIEVVPYENLKRIGQFGNVYYMVDDDSDNKYFYLLR